MSSWSETCVHWLRHTLVVVVVLGVLGGAAALAIMYSGVFNIAATVADSPPVVWALVTVREASIAQHARDVPDPPADMVADRDRGFQIYRANCVMCHTPVGRKPHMMSIGFNPQAPGFGPDSDNMTAKELFWVTKNGIRFTGMPAWGPSMADAEIWDVTAFLMTLPEMTAAEYDAIDQRIPETNAVP